MVVNTSLGSNQSISSTNETVEPVKTEKSIRYLSIDVFRGLAIVTMIFVNVIAPFNKVPAWSKHALDYGLTYVDLVTPFFIFAIGLTYTLSFNRYYEKNGWFQTFMRFIRRYAALFGMGMIGTMFLFTDQGIFAGWGVLQAIGLAGIFTLIFIRFPRTIRFAIGIGLLALYQYILTITVGTRIISTPLGGTISMPLGDLNYYDEHGGVIGGIGFCILLLFCTAIIDDFRKTNKWWILGMGGIFTSAGIIWHVIWKFTDWPPFGGISKERVTPSYILLTVGLGAILFWLLWFIYDKHQLTKNKSILQPIGRNSLFIYIIHPIMIGFTQLILHLDTHAALVMFLGFVSVVILWTVSFFLDRKKFYIVI
jgi:predicted acyltransferase